MVAGVGYCAAKSTGGHARGKVQHPVDREAPRGAGEAPRSARDRSDLFKIEDLGSGVGVAWPTKLATTVSPLAATKLKVPVPIPVPRSTCSS